MVSINIKESIYAARILEYSSCLLEMLVTAFPVTIPIVSAPINDTTPISNPIFTALSILSIKYYSLIESILNINDFFYRTTFFSIDYIHRKVTENQRMRHAFFVKITGLLHFRLLSHWKRQSLTNNSYTNPGK